MGVKEGWGDTMAPAFSNAIVERVKNRDLKFEI
jgi:hypothetical protein